MVAGSSPAGRTNFIFLFLFMKFQTQAASVQFWEKVGEAFARSDKAFFCNCSDVFSEAWKGDKFKEECYVLANCFSYSKFKDDRLALNYIREIMFAYNISLFDSLKEAFGSKEIFGSSNCSCLNRNIRLKFLEWVIPYLKEIKKTP